jgi:hypothetical protein
MHPDGLGPVLTQFYATEGLVELVRDNIRYPGAFRRVQNGTSIDDRRFPSCSLREQSLAQRVTLRRIPNLTKDVRNEPCRNIAPITSDQTDILKGQESSIAIATQQLLPRPKNFFDGNDIEIWEGLRKIIRLPHKAG